MASPGRVIETTGRRYAVAIIMAAALALVCKLWLAWLTFGTNDVYTYTRFQNWAGYLGVRLYREDVTFNHPPSMIHVLALLGWLARITGIGFPFWLRVPSILADTGNLLLVWSMLGARLYERNIFRAVLMLAVAPPLILISGFHGNTDSVMIFFVLLTVWLIERQAPAWAAGTSLGLAMCIKIVPVVAFPVLFFYQTRWRKRVELFAAAGAVMVAGWSPFIFQDAPAIARNVFGYKSYYGYWGFSYLAAQLSTKSWIVDQISTLYKDWGTDLVLGLIAGLSFWMNRRKVKPRLLSQVGIVFLLFLSASNGFGVQYLAWLVPWVVELGALPTALLYATSGVYLFLVYDYWAEGMPWYLADFGIALPGSEAIQRQLDYFHVLCWLSVVAAFWVAWRRVRTGAQGNSWPWRMPRNASRLAVGLFVVAMSSYAIILLVSIQGKRPASRALYVGRPAVSARTAHADLGLALRLYKNGQFREALTFSDKAIRRLPNWAEAHNLKGACYAGMKRWDEAILAAQTAVRLDPHFELARQNLAWALEQKRVRGSQVNAASRPPS